MQFYVGNRLRVDGEYYKVIGKVTYKNTKDNCTWDEYRLIGMSNDEKWLSIDNIYHEYSISWVTHEYDFRGYRVVDEGMEVVVQASGIVDVDLGESAMFKEFEDSTEEKIISIEKWSNGEEVSMGYYLDADEIQMDFGGGSSGVLNNPYVTGATTKRSKKTLEGFATNFFVFIFVGVFITRMFGSCSSNDIISKTAIREYLASSSSFTYVTDVTSNGDTSTYETLNSNTNTSAETTVTSANDTSTKNGKVFTSSLSVDTVAKLIIDGIEGNTKDVQQNTDDGDTSVAILTKYEYCLVYTSEDAITTVQVSSRKYAYSDNRYPYRANSRINRYYRRFYHSRAYVSDKITYSSASTSYDTHTDAELDSAAGDVYRSYSDSVRQSSTSSRSSSGGGTSYGK